MNTRHILIRWFISAAAILATTYLLPGFTITGNGVLVALAVAVILGFVNAIIRPVLVLLSCGCIVATLGLFLLVVNGASLWIASEIAQWFGLGFYVDNYWTAFFGSIVISVISWLLSLFLIGEKEKSR